MRGSSDPAPAVHLHSRVDDAQAVATSVVLTSLGLALLHAAGLTTGGAPGLALLLSEAAGWPLGVSLFVVNIPFYGLAWKELGVRFTVKSVVCVSALSIGVEIVHRALGLSMVEPGYAAIAGGILIGTGLLVLFRHGASLGGINVLALCLQRRFGWSPGKFQLSADAMIFAASVAVLEPGCLAWSLLGAVAVNAVLIWNHRPGRYRGGSDLVATRAGS
jgi:uncharacterized membrane-anchored protein YitT (DUF2179 family)